MPANTSATFTSMERAPTVTRGNNRHLGMETSAAPVDGAQRMAASFTDSVRIHLRSDVPTALLLSAGVDSTAIAGVASGLGHRLHCLTVDGPGMSGEGDLASATANHYGHLHERVEVGIDDADVSGFLRLDATTDDRRPQHVRRLQGGASRRVQGGPLGAGRRRGSRRVPPRPAAALVAGAGGGRSPARSRRRGSGASRRGCDPVEEPQDRAPDRRRRASRRGRPQPAPTRALRPGHGRAPLRHLSCRHPIPFRGWR